jgi:tRNA-dihydrouridine synthase C
VTHPAFRSLILDIGGPGAAWTEFLRVAHHPLSPRVIRREMGEIRHDVPVGVQLMGTQPELVAESAQNAEAVGAPMVDLNFGCPAPKVFKKCAGAALLDHPDRVSALIRATVDAVSVPVTAKIRLGVHDDSRLAEVVAAVAEAGAAALCVHARTRSDAYSVPARWEALARVRAMTRLPLIGNGDVMTVADALRMMHTTGVDGVMVGRGILRDPWLLARLRAQARGEPEPRVSAADLWAFHCRYRDAMAATANSPRRVTCQLKQLYQRLEVGIRLDASGRNRLLRSRTLAELEAVVRHEIDAAECELPLA